MFLFFYTITHILGTPSAVDVNRLLASLVPSAVDVDCLFMPSSSVCVFGRINCCFVAVYILRYIVPLNSSPPSVVFFLSTVSVFFGPVHRFVYTYPVSSARVSGELIVTSLLFKVFVTTVDSSESLLIA